MIKVGVVILCPSLNYIFTITRVLLICTRDGRNTAIIILPSPYGNLHGRNRGNHTVSLTISESMIEIVIKILGAYLNHKLLKIMIHLLK